MNDHGTDSLKYALFNVGRSSGKIDAAYRIAGKLLNEFKQKQKEENMAQEYSGGATVRDFLNTYPAQFVGVKHEEVSIKKVHNGWIIKVGCATFVETSWKKICAALKEYWDDPVKAEKKYYKK